MRTLKKVLSLTLVIAFAFTMMAGAATVFTDDSSIDAETQVNMVYALGIMKGYPDGSFGADKTITRAEAAKMMYVLKTGADEGSANYVNAANPFTDVSSSHWAKGYINYCYLNGIIAGIGGGKFDPEGKLTGAQLAKMCLTALGYDAKKAGLVGDQWLISTMSLAFSNGLFDDYSADVAAAAPREDAAVLFYNTVFCPTVVLRDDEYVNYDLLGNTNPTVGKKNFDLVEYTGIIKGADGVDITTDTTCGAADTLYIDIADDATTGSATAQFDTADGDKALDYEGGKEFLGQKVKVVYDSKKDEVYNVVSTSKNKVYNVIAGDISASGANIKFSDKVYTYPAATAAATVQFVNYAGVGGATYNIAAVTSADPVRLVDNNGDDTIDYVFITGRAADYIDSLDSDKVSFTKLGVLDLENDDDEVMVNLNGAKKGDYVIVYPDIETGVAANNTYYVQVMSTVTGTVNSYSGTKAKVNGTFYSLSDMGGNVGTLNDIDLSEDAGDLGIGDEYTFYMDGKYYMGFVATAETVGSGNYCYVVDAQNKTGTGTVAAKDPKVVVLIPGEDDPVTYVLDSGTISDGLGAGALAIAISKDNMEATVNGGSANTWTNVEGKLFTYTITSSGKIKLAQDFLANYTGKAIVTAGNGASTAGAVSVTYNKDTGVFSDGTNSYLLADDAVVFYYVGGAWETYGEGDFDVAITGTQANLSAIVYKSSGGFKYIKGAVMAAQGTWAAPANVAAGAQTGTASDLIYGYVTGDVEVGEDADGDGYVTYPIFNGTGTASYIEEDTSTPLAAKGNFVVYKLDADGNIKSGSLLKLDSTAGAGIKTTADLASATPAADTPFAGAIKAYNESTGYVTIADKNAATFTGVYKIDSDVQIVVVDTGDKKGLEGYTGTSAFRTIGVGTNQNCVAVFNSDYELIAIIVDVDNDMTAKL